MMLKQLNIYFPYLYAWSYIYGLVYLVMGHVRDV